MCAADGRSCSLSCFLPTVLALPLLCWLVLLLLLLCRLRCCGSWQQRRSGWQVRSEREGRTCADTDGGTRLTLRCDLKWSITHTHIMHTPTNTPSPLSPPAPASHLLTTSPHQPLPPATTYHSHLYPTPTHPLTTLATTLYPPTIPTQPSPIYPSPSPPTPPPQVMSLVLVPSWPRRLQPTLTLRTCGWQLSNWSLKTMSQNAHAHCWPRWGGGGGEWGGEWGERGGREGGSCWKRGPGDCWERWWCWWGGGEEWDRGREGG